MSQIQMYITLFILAVELAQKCEPYAEQLVDVATKLAEHIKTKIEEEVKQA